MVYTTSKMCGGEVLSIHDHTLLSVLPVVAISPAMQLLRELRIVIIIPADVH